MKIHPHWQQHVAAWRHSGLSQAAYCRLHALNGKTFSRWARVVAASGTSSIPAVIPVRLSASPSPLVLRLERGASVELSTAVSPPWLAELLKCLA